MGKFPVLVPESFREMSGGKNDALPSLDCYCRDALEPKHQNPAAETYYSCPAVNKCEGNWKREFSFFSI